MAGFRTSGEQSKWEALQNTASTSFDKLLQGQATPADIAQLGKIIKQQNEMASKLFEDGIAGAENTADAVIDRMNQDRIALGKNPLTPKAQDRLFKQTFQKVLSAAAEDIIGSIHDLLEEQGQEQQEQLETAFERLSRIQQERRAREEIPKSLSEKLRALGKKISEVGERVSQRVGYGAARVAQTPAAPEAESNHRGIRQFSAGLRSRAGSAATATTTFVKSSVTAIKDATTKGWDFITRRNTDDDEETRAGKWLRKIKGMFGNVKDKVGGGAKKATSFLSKLLGPIGKVLLLALTNPQLIKTITDAISEYLNFDTVSDFLAATWKDIKSTGSEVMDWLIKKVKDFFVGDKSKAVPKTEADKQVIATSVAKNSAIPANTTVSDARNAIPEIESKIKATKIALAKSQARLAADPSDDNKISVSYQTQRLQILQGQLQNYQSVISKPTAKPADVRAIAPPVAAAAPASVTAPTASDVTSVPEGKQSKTTVVPTQNRLTGPAAADVLATSTAGTTAVPDISPKYKDGQTVEPPKAETSGAGDRAADKSNMSAGIISMGSFGYQSGDDTLNLLNMGLIG